MLSISLRLLTASTSSETALFHLFNSVTLLCRFNNARDATSRGLGRVDLTRTLSTIQESSEQIFLTLSLILQYLNGIEDPYSVLDAIFKIIPSCSVDEPKICRQL